MDEVIEAARVALDAADLLHGGWTVAACRRRDPETVEVILTPPGDADGAVGKGIGLEWSQPQDPAARAFRKGPRYSCSYRRSPTLWDIDAEDTPTDVHDRAYAACDVLAALVDGPELYEPPAAEPEPVSLPPVEQPPEPLPANPIDALVVAVGYSLERELGTALLPNPEGWEVVEVRPFRHWARIAEAHLRRREDHNLTFIVTPHDFEQPCFRRTEHFQLVYYSDDFTINEHTELYARDAAMIERFTDWFEAWDSRGGGPRANSAAE